MNENNTDTLDAFFWNNRYATNSFGWDLGQISPPLKSYIDQIENKHISILIPGCGNSYEAAYLIESGFTNVTVIDIAEIPITRLKNVFDGNAHIKILKEDFFKHKKNYDLILEQTFFCAIHPSLRKKYAEHMNQLLHINGRLIGVLFKSEFEKEGPPFGGNKNEYESLFQKFFFIHKMEECYNSIQPRDGNELFIMIEKR